MPLARNRRPPIAATVRADYYGASATEPAGVTAETGITYSLDDAENGTTPVVIPNSTGTNFSWYKLLALDVTATAATSLSNRKVSQASTPTTQGIKQWFLDQATYTQPSGANKPADNGSSNGATPTGYTAISTTPATWDATSHSAGSSGRNGDFCQIVMGVDTTALVANGGPGPGSITLQTLTLAYDEA